MTEIHARSTHVLVLTLPRGELGEGIRAIADSAILEGYLRDESKRVGHAEALYRPRNEAEVSWILREAMKARRKAEGLDNEPEEEEIDDGGE